MTNVYIKKDGVTTKLKESSLSNKAFQTYRVDAIDKLKGVEIVRATDLILTAVRKVLDSISKDSETIYSDLINKLMIKVVNFQSNDELVTNEDSIYNTIMSTYLYDKRKYNDSKKLYSYFQREVEHISSHLNCDYVPSMAGVIKDIVRRYIKLEIGKLNADELDSTYQAILDGDDPTKYIKVEGKPLSEIDDETLKILVSKLVIPEINNRYNESSQHLCGDCKVPIKDCPKIMDRFFKLIDQYDFITDGKQLTHEGKVLHRFTGPDRVMQEEVNIEEIVDEFTVTKCKKYIK